MRRLLATEPRRPGRTGPRDRGRRRARPHPRLRPRPQLTGPANCRKATFTQPGRVNVAFLQDSVRSGGASAAVRRHRSGRGRSARSGRRRGGFCAGFDRLRHRHAARRARTGDPDQLGVAGTDPALAALDAGLAAHPVDLALLLAGSTSVTTVPARRRGRCGRSGAGSPWGRPAGRRARPGSTSSTWMPRAATSVATSDRRRLPSRNAASARVRAPWALPPCRAPAATPSRRSCLARRSAPCLVRTNTIVRPSRAAISVTTAACRRCRRRAGGAPSSSTCAGRRVDRVGHRVVQVAADELVDVAVERGGEQQPLAVGRGQVEQRGDLRAGSPCRPCGRPRRATTTSTSSRSQVRWSIRSVSRPGVATRMSTPRRSASACRSNDMPPTTEATRQAERLRERRERVADLLRQLAGRDEHEAAGARGCGAPAGEAGEQRQAEGEGLARAGLAAAEHVAAGEGVGDGGGLDRERRGDAAAVERGDTRLGQAELGEGGHPRAFPQRASLTDPSGDDRLLATRACGPGAALATRAATRLAAAMKERSERPSDIDGKTNLRDMARLVFRLPRALPRCLPITRTGPAVMVTPLMSGWKHRSTAVFKPSFRCTALVLADHRPPPPLPPPRARQCRWTRPDAAT